MKRKPRYDPPPADTPYGKYTAHPVDGTCYMCSLPLSGRLTKHARGWVHRDCWAGEHE